MHIYGTVNAASKVVQCVVRLATRDTVVTVKEEV